MLKLALLLNLIVQGHPYLMVKGIPLLSYSSQTGVGYGLRIGLFSYKDQQAEYNWNLYGQFFNTTGGIKSYRLYFDRKGMFRLTGTAEYNKTLYENFYPASDYYPITEPIGDTVYTYIHTKWFIRGIARYKFVFLMLEHQHHKIGVRNHSLLEYANPPDIDGGDITGVQAGIFLDKRDYEGDPTRGYVFQLTYGLWFGDYSFKTFFASLKGYMSVPNDVFTVAMRGACSCISDGAPFFAYGWNYSIQPFEGLGGRNSLRGYPTFYYMSNRKYILNNEIRFRMFSFNMLGSRWTIESVVGWDAGIAHLIDFRNFYGGQNNKAFFSAVLGLRFMWGRDFIIAIDYGRSKSFSTFDITFDHAF